MARRTRAVAENRKKILAEAVDAAVMSDMVELLHNHAFAKAVIDNRQEIEKIFDTGDAVRHKLHLT